MMGRTKSGGENRTSARTDRIGNARIDLLEPRQLLAATYGTVGGFAWNDRNGDGIVQAIQSGGGDTALWGVKVYVDYNNDKKPGASEPSGEVMSSGGYFVIPNVLTGNYPVRLSLPAGMTQIKPSGGYGFWVTVKEDQTVTTGTFLAWQPTTKGDVSGFVWEDANGNSVLDGAEDSDTTPQGTKVFADLDNDGALDSSEPVAKTDSVGSYRISGLTAPKSYAMRVIPPAGWQQTEPENNWPINIKTQRGWTIQVRGFGMMRSPALGSVQGFAYNDLDGNGTIAGMSESSLLKVPIYVDYDNDKKRDAGEPSATVMGAVNGYFKIDYVLPGKYPVRLDLPSGYVQIKPTSGFGYWVTVKQNQTASTGTFMAWQPAGWLRAVAFNDANGNGKADDGASLPMAVTMFVDLDLDGKLDTNEPSKDVAAGYFGAFFLKTGNYTLRIVTPAGWRQTTPLPGTGRTGTVTARGVTNLAGFGLQKI